jgi:hypothetical protein
MHVIAAREVNPTAEEKIDRLGYREPVTDGDASSITIVHTAQVLVEINTKDQAVTLWADLVGELNNVVGEYASHNRPAHLMHVLDHGVFNVTPAKLVGERGAEPEIVTIQNIEASPVSERLRVPLTTLERIAEKRGYACFIIVRTLVVSPGQHLPGDRQSGVPRAQAGSAVPWPEP